MVIAYLSIDDPERRREIFELAEKYAIETHAPAIAQDNFEHKQTVDLQIICHSVRYSRNSAVQKSRASKIHVRLQQIRLPPYCDHGLINGRNGPLPKCVQRSLGMMLGLNGMITRTGFPASSRADIWFVLLATSDAMAGDRLKKFGAMAISPQMNATAPNNSKL